MQYLNFLFQNRETGEEFLVEIKADTEQQPNLQPYVEQAKAIANDYFNNPKYFGLVDDDYGELYGIDTY